MGNLEEINKELAAVVDELNATPSTDFAKRHELRTRQDELRKLADMYRTDFDKSRSTVALERELRARQAQLDAVYMSGGVSRTGGSCTSAEEGGLNPQIRKASNSAEIRARIAKLEDLLADQESSGQK